MAKLNLLDLSEAKAEAMKISNVSGSSTAANPSADLTQALSGFPAAAGKAVTRQTAVRVGAVLSSVKTLAQDIAKMPLRVIEQTKVNGRIRTSTAIDHPLFPIFTYQPNRYQVPFNWQFYLATQLLMNGNAFCQKITNGDGDILELVPLDAWAMTVKWDFDAPLRTQAGDQITQVVANGQKVPVLCWDYYGGQGKVRRFYQPEIFHVVNCNIEGNGFEGSQMIALGKEAISLLNAAEEAHGRNFANNLGMQGFISFPAESSPDETQAQDIVDRFKKDFSGSQNSGKFTVMPNGGKWENMSYNPQQSQVLDSRKWSEQEIARMWGGAPLIVKLGLGEQNSTYASSSAFLDEYFNTSLLPHTTQIEQAIVRDCLDKSEWGKVFVKYNADIILRGSPKERAETNQILIQSGQMTLEEARVLEDRDYLEGSNILTLQSGACVFDVDEQEWFLPGQKPPTDDGEDGTDPDVPPTGEPDVSGAGSDDEGVEQPPAKPQPKKKKKANNRFEFLAKSAVERIMRAEEKKPLEQMFVAAVLGITPEQSETFISNRAAMTKEDARAELTRLALGETDDSEE